MEEIVNCLLACAIPFQPICVSIFYASNLLSCKHACFGIKRFDINKIQYSYYVIKDIKIDF